MEALKPRSPYVYKFLRLFDMKNPVEPKNDKFVAKTYISEVTKCDEIFYLLVADGQIIVPKRLKSPSLEPRNKIGFFNFHNYLGHKTSLCVIFRDLVQGALNEGKLKFVDKGKALMLDDSDPLHIK